MWHCLLLRPRTAWDKKEVINTVWSELNLQIELNSSYSAFLDQALLHTLEKSGYMKNLLHPWNLSIEQKVLWSGLLVLHTKKKVILITIHWKLLWRAKNSSTKVECKFKLFWNIVPLKDLLRDIYLLIKKFWLKVY